MTHEMLHYYIMRLVVRDRMTCSSVGGPHYFTRDLLSSKSCHVRCMKNVSLVGLGRLAILLAPFSVFV
jgi:hypothetical protein